MPTYVKVARLVFKYVIKNIVKYIYSLLSTGFSLKENFLIFKVKTYLLGKTLLGKE